MPPAYAYVMERNDASKSIKIHPQTKEQINVVKRVIGAWTPKSEGDACNFGPGCQISIIEDMASKHVPDILPDLTKRLNEIYYLSDDWDGQGTAAPNARAFLHAWEVIGVLGNMNFAPANLVPSAEEGIGIYFTKEKKYGFVECFNEGEIVVAMSDREGHRRVWQIRDTKDEIEDALEILKDFINAA
jgi:hypothetical protein